MENSEVRCGYWIEKTHWFGSFGKTYHRCSECGTEYEGVPFTRGDGKGSKFCEECGVKMSRKVVKE